MSRYYKQLTTKQISILEKLYFDNATINLSLDPISKIQQFHLQHTQPMNDFQDYTFPFTKVSHQDLTSLMNAGALRMTDQQTLVATAEVPLILARMGIATEDLYPHHLTGSYRSSHSTKGRFAA